MINHVQFHLSTDLDGVSIFTGEWAGTHARTDTELTQVGRGLRRNRLHLWAMIVYGPIGISRFEAL